MLVPTEPNIVNLSAVLNRADDRGGCASPRSVAGSARRAARPRGCGGCRPYHCDEREARCSCSSPCCRSWPLAAARPCRRCTVRPSRFTRWRTDRRFSELVRHRAGGAGPNTTFCRPAGTFYRGGAGRRRRNCTRCADRVASSSTRCCRLLNAFARHAECITVHAGLVPVTIGLIAASALIIVRDADHEWTGLAISAATGALVYATRLSPLAAFARRGTPGVRGFRVTITMNAFGAGRPCARHGLEHKLIQLPGREGLDVGDAAAGRDNQSIEPN